MKHSEFKEILNQSKEYKEAVKSKQISFDFANAVLSARLAKGWSQADLANAIGTKQANISRIETGLANPTLSMVNKISKVLELRFSIVNESQYKIIVSSNFSESNKSNCDQSIFFDQVEETVPECILQWSINYKVQKEKEEVSL